MKTSRIPKFYNYEVRERLEILREKGNISAEDFKRLTNGGGILDAEGADKMVENVIGVFGLPIGLGLYFLVNDKDYVVPMVVEEPSVVAAVSSAAKLIRGNGGFKTKSTDPVMIGQIQVVEIPHPSHARQAVLQKKEEIINLANSIHPNMVARGGGAKDVEAFIHPSTYYRCDMLIVHLLVDTRDAMGANLVNSMCEGVASLIEKITGGKVFLRILSNLTDRSLVSAKCVIPTHLLAGKGHSGEDVRDGIILANEFASVDPYRAATHNKGIMNGIDAVALATGNDWRAIEASAHAYAARGHGYTSLTKWYKTEEGHLAGKIKLALKVGTVGSPLQMNPTVRILLNLLNVSSATQLAEVMAAVGLAQNFSAIRALSTEGIQQGHMTLHARSVAAAGGATADIYEEVVDQLIESGEIKVWKSEEIVKKIQEKKLDPTYDAHSNIEKIESEEHEGLAYGSGKIIFFGEHAAVYGSHVVAAPIPIAIRSKIEDEEEGIHIVIPRWGVEKRLHNQVKHDFSLYKSLDIILRELDIRDKHMRIEIYPHIPRAMGMGGSAALAVAIIRAMSEHYKLNLSDENVNKLAYKSEQIVHGTPSGIDNTMATYGKFILFKKGDPPLMKPIAVPRPLPVVIGITHVESLTAHMVSNVRKAREKNPVMYDRIFNEIDELALYAFEALCTYDLEKLGDLMNLNHGLLNALQVSHWELEELVSIARANGALGAKLTGGGGGGAMIALTEDWEGAQNIADEMRKAGYRALTVQVK
jgi:hydroxymethylglutaryl-CoA reductase